MKIIINGLIFCVSLLGLQASGDETEDAKIDTTADAKITTLATDKKALSDAITKALEKTLKKTGIQEKNVSVKERDKTLRDELAEVVTSAIDEGNKVEDIDTAVKTALLGLKKSNKDINDEIVQSMSNILQNILGSNKKLVEGDPTDNYIQSLNSEVKKTIVNNEKTAPKTATNGAENKKVEQPVVTTTASIEKMAKMAKKVKKAVSQDKKKEAVKIKTITEGSIIIVQKGESLSRIALRLYGDVSKYHQLYKANKDVISHPNNIREGMRLKLIKK